MDTADYRQLWRRSVRRYVRNYRAPGHPDYWAPTLDTAPREQLRHIQARRLASTYRYLWHNSPFHRQRFEALGLGVSSVRGLEDLTRLPLTFREEWLRDQEEHAPWGTFSPLRQQDWLERGWMLFTTSGTTAARPRVFRHTTFDRDMWSWLGARALYAMGVRRGDIAINCFGYGTSVAFWGLHYALTHMGVPVIAGGGVNTERRALFIKSYQPTVLLCTPSYALYLGRTMEQAGGNPQGSSIRTIVAAGEPGACIPSTKRRIEALWNAQVHDDFGCTEVAMTPLGYTCGHQVRQHDHPVEVHLMDDVYITEVLDPSTWKPVADGERGVLVVSNLFSEAQPALRYVMGDWAVKTEEPCACGRTHARLVGGLQGRNDALLKIRGLLFFPSVLEDAVRAMPFVGDEFRIDITQSGGMDVAHVIIEPDAAVLGVPHDLEERARCALRGALGIDVRVQVVNPGVLERFEFKARRIRDHRETMAANDSQATAPLIVAGA